MKVGIIGGGVFGCCTALELAKSGHRVTVFERENNLFTGASTVNHLRHHYGFHYPRSNETVEEIKFARTRFENVFGESVSGYFPDYYGVAKEGSKTTPDDFIAFCDRMNLPYEVTWPGDDLMNRDKVAICIKTPERVYDPDILKGIILRNMKGLPITLKLNHKVVGGEKIRAERLVTSECAGETFQDRFDGLVNATYSNFNSFNKWFGFPRKKLQYELVELLELFVPNQEKIGLTIMDGEFSSVLPRGEKGTFTLGHVDASVLERKVGDDIDPVVMTSGNQRSNRDEILVRGIEDFPVLNNARIIGSLYVTRVVKSGVDDTDERPSEITNYGDNMFSIFGGKVLTCVNVAERVAGMLEW